MGTVDQLFMYAIAVMLVIMVITIKVVLSDSGKQSDK